MSIYNDFMKNLNEGKEVKKTFGDVPQEGKTEKLEKGKHASIPKGRGNIEKYKATKLQNVNKQAIDVYPNDTDKVMDNIADTKHSDKGVAAKTIGKKADRKIRYPFGDKVEQSDSKLIKESEEVEIEKKDETLKEDYDNGTWKQHEDAVKAEIDAAKEDMEEDAFCDFCDGIINYCQNYTGDLNQFECAKLEESDATNDFVEDLKNFLNKHCRQDIKVAELSEDGNIVTLDNIKVNIAADSNLAAVLDIVNRLLK